MRPAEFALPSVCSAQSLHFIGVGGVGMSGLATLFAQTGYRVSGSDVSENGYTKKLAMLGARVMIGPQAPENVPDESLVVISTAIDADNPEFLKAKAAGLSICHRSGLLRSILQEGALGIPFEHTIGITGTHGKTTLTAMAGWIMDQAGLEPTVIAGGKMLAWQHTAKLGSHLKIAVAELDESDGSLLTYQPTMSVLTNLELDHAEHFPGGIAELEAHFVQFVKNLPATATVIVNDACPRLSRLFLSEGTPPSWTATICPLSAFCLPDEVALPFPGAQYQLNAKMALALAAALNIDQATALSALATFPGVGRRLERLGTWTIDSEDPQSPISLQLLDDYAHHPTEVSVTLAGLRQQLPQGARLIAVFQPHRFTRLQALWDEFLTCFDCIDAVWITPVFAAHEPAIPNITHSSFADALRSRLQQQPFPHTKLTPQNVFAAPSDDWSLLREALKGFVKPGDSIVTLGAGSITFLLRGLS
ncbi:MAG: Mur ligase domain-containing protein [Vampirovibrionales bacterium]|nr:Mur ligase domain-containing protein [Vampirovibrionales bacterium]